jgi:arsenite methyltransferase
MLRRILIISLSLVLLTVILSFGGFKEWIKSAFYISHMEGENRVSEMQLDRVVATLGLDAGDLVADIGAGSGLFSRKIAEKVGPHGRVYAADINRDLLRHIDEVNREKGVNNIITVAAIEDDPKIPAPVDLIFICDTMHYIDNQEKYVKRMSSYLKQRGRIAVISFKRSWPPLANRFTEDDLTAWMKNAGMDPAGSYDFIQDQYLMIFEKRPR